MNPDQPLGLPKGSIRAILALLLVVPVAFLVATSGIRFTADQAIGIVSLVIAAYFVQKASGGNA